jgi:hypothetical protein
MPPKRGRGIEEEKRGRGRPRQRPTDREEAKRQAIDMFDDFKNNRLDITEAALRRKINLLGEIPNTGGRERWFSYSNRRGVPQIVDYQRSTPRVQEAKSSVADDIKRQQDEDEMKKQKREETLREQVDIEKVQAQERAKTKEVEKRFGEFKPLQGEELRRFKGEETLDDLRKLIRGERKMDQSLFDKIADVLGKERQELKVPEVKRPEVKRPEVKRPEPTGFDWSEIVLDPAEAQKQMVDFKEVEEKKVEMKKRREEAYVSVPPSGKRVRRSPEPEPEKEYGYDLDYKHDVGLPYINELINGEVEEIPNLEDLNQNVVGINEREGRNLVFEEDQEMFRESDLFRQAERFLREDKVERSLEPEEDEYEPLLIPDAESRASREVSNTKEYLARRYGERKAQERMNLIPEIQEQSRGLLLDSLENKMQELGMNVPQRIIRMGNETLSGLIRDAKIGVSLEDIEGMIGEVGVPISEIAQQLPSAIAQRLPELKSVGEIVSRIPEGMKSNISAGLGLLSDAYGIYDRAPESMIKKIREAGGTVKDIAKIPIKREEKKDEREEKKQPIRRTGLFGEEDDDGDDKKDDDDDKKDDDKKGLIIKRTGGPDAPETDPQQLLLEQINNINQKLGDMGGSGKLAYPEERKTEAYRFPKPNENYDAIQLIQNSTTGFLNDLNLYGDAGLEYDPILDI